VNSPWTLDRSILPLLFGLVCMLSACQRTPTHGPASLAPFVGCYLVRYDDWGPSRQIGMPIGSVAPAVIILQTQRPDPRLAFGQADSSYTARVQENTGDTTFYPAYWRPLSADSISVILPFEPGLFGLGYLLHPYGDSLGGSAESYTDTDAKQATSHVSLSRFPCPRGA